MLSFLARLHREALKQSAMDPKTGMIDINILTTGLSITDRKRRQDIAKALDEFIRKKGKVTTLPLYKTSEEFREQSDEVCIIPRPLSVSHQDPYLYHTKIPICIIPRSLSVSFQDLSGAVLHGFFLIRTFTLQMFLLLNLFRLLL